MTIWLLEQRVRAIILKAEHDGVQPTAEQQENFLASMASFSGDAPRIMSVADDKAEISVKGVLTKEPNFLAMLLGGGNTTYSEIITALATADASDAIKEIILKIDSPGGTVNGLFDTLSAISSTKKPVKAVVSDHATSAAFAIAAQADEIVASNQSAIIGSVGVVKSFFVNDKEVEVTNTESPKKRPDVKTPAGVAVVKEELDAIHNLFVKSISEGRSAATGKAITSEDVNENFGQGGIVLAGEAIKRGMIDGIEDKKFETSGDIKTASSDVLNMNKDENKTIIEDKEKTTNREEVAMKIEDLKKEHPGIYASAVEEGRAAGVKEERDNVVAHLTMGEASGDMETAIKAITDGSPMTATYTALYNAAAIKKGHLVAAEADETEVDAALKGASGEGLEAEGVEEEVHGAVAAHLKGKGLSASL